MRLIEFGIVNAVMHQVKGIIKGLTRRKDVGLQKVKQSPKLGQIIRQGSTVSCKEKKSACEGNRVGIALEPKHKITLVRRTPLKLRDIPRAIVAPLVKRVWYDT